MQLQQLRHALLDEAKVRKHVLVGNLGRVADDLANERRVAANVGKHAADARLERLHRALGPVKTRPVQLLLRRRRRELVLHAVDVHRLGHLPCLASRFIPIALGADARDLVLQLLDLRVDLVHVVEQRVVLVLGGDKRVDKRVNVLDPSGALDLLKRPSVLRDLLCRDVLLERLVVVSAARRATLLRLIHRRGAHLEQLLRLALARRELALALALALTLVLLDDARELAPLLLKARHLLLGLQLEHVHLRNCLLLGLKRHVGKLDRLRHRLFQLGQLALQRCVNAEEHDLLAAQIVDLVAQLLVVRHTLVVLHIRLLQAVLKQLGLHLQRDHRLARGVHAAHGGARLRQEVAGLVQLHVQHLGLAHLHDDLAREHVALVLQAVDERLRVRVARPHAELVLQQQVMLELLVLLTQLLDGRLNFRHDAIVLQRVVIHGAGGVGRKRRRPARR
mmetsp:Transcript_14857/g.43647  ORF Transcript_14857/g.43647 Transcript_14857/m.43647 type:complete len:450 (+) Transcript_14857:510-1859(+)